jgi:hypothetical protein
MSGRAAANQHVEDVSEVTVALAGDAKSPPPGAIDWYSVRWEDAQKITLRVSGDETLAEILDRASVEFGAPPFGPFERPYRSAHWIAFEDDSGRTLLQKRLTELTLIDDKSELSWSVSDWTLVPYRQLQLSAEAGLISGDVRRVYFIRQIPQGDIGFIIHSWDVFLRCWDVAWSLLEHLATVGEAAGGYMAIRAVVRRALKPLKRQFPFWAQRGATPMSLPEAFAGADDSELARRLGLSDDEAADLRAFFVAINGDDALLTALHRAIAIVEPQALHGGSTDYVALFRAHAETIVQGGDPHDSPLPLDKFEVDMGRWMRETFNLPDIPNDEEAAADARRFEEEAYDDEDYDSIFISFPLAIAWMILLPGLIVGVALDADWEIRLIAAIGTTAVLAAIALVQPLRNAVSKAFARILPGE